MKDDWTKQKLERRNKGLPEQTFEEYKKEIKEEQEKLKKEAEEKEKKAKGKSGSASNTSPVKVSSAKKSVIKEEENDDDDDICVQSTCPARLAKQLKSLPYCACSTRSDGAGAPQLVTWFYYGLGLLVLPCWCRYRYVVLISELRIP